MFIVFPFIVHLEGMKRENIMYLVDILCIIKIQQQDKYCVNIYIPNYITVCIFEE